jgi:hypothetical protein
MTIFTKNINIKLILFKKKQKKQYTILNGLKKTYTLN